MFEARLVYAFSILGGNLRLRVNFLQFSNHISHIFGQQHQIILKVFWPGPNCKIASGHWDWQRYIPYYQLRLVPSQKWMQLESTPLNELLKIVDNRCLQLLQNYYYNYKICLRNRPPGRTCGNQGKIARKFRTIKLVICTIYPLVMVSPTITIGDALTLIPNWWSKRTITLA